MSAVDEPIRRSIQAVLGLGIVIGAAMGTYFLVLAPETPLAWDFAAYIAAGDAYLADEGFVGVGGRFGEGEFVYPPLIVLAFVPYALLGIWPAFLVHATVNVALLGVLGWLIVHELRQLGVTIGPRGRALIVAFCVLSLYPMISIGQGQVDPLIAVLIAGTFLSLERHRPGLAGCLLATAAVVKVFPLALGLWFVRLRRWRAATTAAFLGLAALLASLAVFGVSIHRSYLGLLVHDRSRLEAFAAGMSPDVATMTLVRPVATALPDVHPVAYPVLAAVLVAPALAVAFVRVDDRLDRHLAFLALLLALLLVAPSTHLNHLIYLYFPLVVLLVGLPAGRGSHTLLAGTVILLVPIQPGILRIVAVNIGAPTPVLWSIDTVITPLLSVVSVPVIGALFLLAGCAVASVDRTDAPIRAVRRALATQPPDGQP